MNVGIVTQPLCGNYGGILQNYALQTVLKSLGCNPITLDLQTHLNVSYIDYIKSLAIIFIKNVLTGSKRKYPSYNQVRPALFDEFVSRNIHITEVIKSYTEDLVDTHHLDSIVVGSDQVWRPRFNVFPEDMFLAFVEKRDVRKIAYAASFGVDVWEYDQVLADKCSHLASKFNAISVRESSGMKLCHDYLKIGAKKVLDPTLLLDISSYNEICKEVETSPEKYVAVYTLNLTEKAKDEINTFAHERGFLVKFFTSDADSELSVPEWLATIRDAEFVITDSFHGTAFSIIYNKEFYSIINKSRGTSRFDSILAEFGLKDRLLDSDCLEIPKKDKRIDWVEVNRRRIGLKEESFAFLRNALFG